MGNFSVIFRLLGRDDASGPIGRVRGMLSGLRTQATVTGRVLGLPRVSAGIGGVVGAFGNLRSQVSGLVPALAGLAGGLSVGGFLAWMRGAADAAAAADDFGKLVGLSASQLAGWRYSMELAGGGTAEDFQGSVSKLTKNIGDAANGMGAAKDVFAAMGVSLRGPNGEIKNTNQVLMDLSAKFALLKSPAEKQAVAMALFGKSGGKMALVLEQGTAALSAQLEQGRAYIGMTDDLAESGGAFMDAQDRLGYSFGFIRNQIARGVLPVLTPLIDRIGAFIRAASPDLIARFTAAIGELAGEVSSWFETSADGSSRAGRALADFGDWMGTARRGVTSTVEVIGGWHNALIGVAAFMAAPMVAAVVGVVGAFANLGASIVVATAKLGWFMVASQAAAFKGVVADLRKGVGAAKAFSAALKANPIGLIITGLELVIGLGVILYKNFEPFRNLIDGIVSKIKSIADAVTGGVLGRALSAMGLGGGDVAAAPSGGGEGASPGGGSGGLPPIQPQAAAAPEGAVTVRFENPPPGMRVERPQAQNMRLATETAGASVGEDMTGW